MKKSLLFYFCAMMLNTPLTHATDLPENLENIAQPIEFTRLPLELQVEIISQTDRPVNGTLINKKLLQGMRAKYIWAKSDDALVDKVNEAFDESGEVIPGSRILHAFTDPTHMILLKRLLLLSGAVEDELVKYRVRKILTKHVLEDLFFYKDTLIEISRHKPEMRKTAIELARGEFIHGCPMVHSELVSFPLTPYLHSAVLEIAHVEGKSIYRVWRFPTHPQQATLTTVGLHNDEEYPLLYPVLVNGRVQTDETKILYRNRVPRDWPVTLN